MRLIKLHSFFSHIECGVIGCIKSQKRSLPLVCNKEKVTGLTQEFDGKIALNMLPLRWWVCRSVAPEKRVGFFLSFWSVKRNRFLLFERQSCCEGLQQFGSWWTPANLHVYCMMRQMIFSNDWNTLWDVISEKFIWLNLTRLSHLRCSAEECPTLKIKGCS